MKLQRRNLWVAKNGGCDNPKCAVAECREDESQLHLATCQYIRADFWDIIYEVMRSIGLKASNDAIFWITGHITDPQTGVVTGHASSEAWSVVAWAWRSLYAETVKCHMEDKQANLNHAVFSTIRYMISRSKAYGYKWRNWYIRQEHHKDSLMFPLKHRSHAMIQLNAFAEYKVSDRLLVWFKWARER